MGNPTSWWSIDDTLLLPGLEVFRFGYSTRVLDPLDHLGHRYEVNVFLVLQYVIDPIKESVEEFRIVL